ncbi:hypothetical protein I546_6011 [Mycobacterium kansasii 732]|nr:hypothetical protein I546_6011 [Mycobacterium kansasii 732]
MGKSRSCYPSLALDGRATGVVSHAGAVVLLRAPERVRLTGALSGALAPWRKPLASHDPARSCSMWLSRWRSVGTAWLMSACCAPNPGCSVRSHPIPPCRG